MGRAARVFSVDGVRNSRSQLDAKRPGRTPPEKGDPLDPAAVCICRNPGGLPNVYEGQRELRQALMPYLILSDIHGNREALEAVLDHA
jgi:hypothetical protein